MQSEKRKSQKSGEKEREKVGKLRNTVFFQCFVAPEARKVGSLKRRVRRHLVRWEMKNCTPLWREAHFEVKRITKNTTGFGPLLDVEMSKKRTLSRHEAYFEVKHSKTHHVWSTFGSTDVEKLYAVVARSTLKSADGLGPLLALRFLRAIFRALLVISSCNFSCSFGDFFVQFFVLFWWFLRAIFRALFVISSCNLSCFFVILCTVYLFSDFSTWKP